MDFDLCDGIVEIIWREKLIFHSTLSCTTNENYVQFGSSVQISKTLVQRIKTLFEMNAKEKDINKKVRSINEIMDLKLKNLKNIYK